MKSPAEIAAFTSDVGVVKSKLGIPRMIALGFLAGFFITTPGRRGFRKTSEKPILYVRVMWYVPR